MSGHSHWSNIKRKKEKKDKKRSKKFSRLSKMITTAVRESGGEKDPDMNPTLATVIEKAKKEDMPKDNIEKAIKKGTGKGKEGSLKEFTMEVYGPEGLAVIMIGNTDNKNRTVSQIEQILKKNGGKMAKPGSVTWLFDRKGVIEIEKSEENELFSIDAGAEATTNKDNTLIVYTPPEKLKEVKENLKSKTELESFSLGYKPKRETSLNDEQKGFLEKLEDHDEIDQVYFTTK